MATLYGLGLGPGDPELITVKALNILKSIPVISYICNPQGHSMALDIVSTWVNDKLRQPIVMDMSNDLATKEQSYASGAKNIEGHLHAGRDVAFLCLGDPLLYATFSKLLPHFHKPTSITVIPGINSAQSAAAAMVQPLILGEESLCLISAQSRDEEIINALNRPGSLAIFKVGHQWKKLLGLIKASGRLAQASICYRLGQKEERILPLSEMTSNWEDYFTLIIVSPHARHTDH